MIGASGVGKTANFLYPNIEYCCAAGMSFVTTDSKGDLYRNTATIAEKYYGYKISVIDLRNPTRSSGYNMLYLVNKYFDLYKSEGKLEYKAKAKKFAKITAKTIISADGDVSSMGQNAFFYESAEGLLASVILLVTEFCPPEKRHIIRRSDGSYILSGTNKPVEPRTMHNRFKAVLKCCGIRNANFHLLRHTYATVCIESGFDAKTVSELLGHSNVNIALNRYVHSSMEMKKRCVDRLNLVA